MSAIIYLLKHEAFITTIDNAGSVFVIESDKLSFKSLQLGSFSQLSAPYKCWFAW